jgi:hypothetical protein
MGGVVPALEGCRQEQLSLLGAENEYVLGQDEYVCMSVWTDSLYWLILQHTHISCITPLLSSAE